MKIYRCLKLGGKPLPETCHLLTGEKENCASVIMTDDTGDIITDVIDTTWFF